MQNNFTLSFRQHNTKGRQPWPIDKVYDSLQREIWKRASDSDGLFWCKCGKQVCKVLVHSWKFVAACRETCEVGEQEYKGLKRQSNSSRRKSDQKNQKRESHSEINTSKLLVEQRAQKRTRNEHAAAQLICPLSYTAAPTARRGGQSACAAVPLNVTMVTFHCDVRIFTFLTKCDNTHNIMWLYSHLT